MATKDGPGRFAALLQRYRTAVGLSQEELAERAGLSRRGISDLERGERRSPHPITVRRLAEGLGLDAEARAALVSSAHAAGWRSANACSQPAGAAGATDWVHRTRAGVGRPSARARCESSADLDRRRGRWQDTPGATARYGGIARHCGDVLRRYGYGDGAP